MYVQTEACSKPRLENLCVEIDRRPHSPNGLALLCPRPVNTNRRLTRSMTIRHEGRSSCRKARSYYLLLSSGIHAFMIKNTNCSPYVLVSLPSFTLNRIVFTFLCIYSLYNISLYLQYVIYLTYPSNTFHLQQLSHFVVLLYN